MTPEEEAMLLDELDKKDRQLAELRAENARLKEELHPTKTWCVNCGHPKTAAGFGVYYVHTANDCTYLDYTEGENIRKWDKSCPCKKLVLGTEKEARRALESSSTETH